MEGGVEGVWELIADDREMKINKKEEVDGMVVYPLKAGHMVTHTTASELCHLFSSPDKRTE